MTSWFGERCCRCVMPISHFASLTCWSEKLRFWIGKTLTLFYQRRRWLVCFVVVPARDPAPLGFELLDFLAAPCRPPPPVVADFALRSGTLLGRSRPSGRAGGFGGAF